MTNQDYFSNSSDDEQPDEIKLDSSKKEFLSEKQKAAKQARLKKESSRKRQEHFGLKKLSLSVLQDFSKSLKEGGEANKLQTEKPKQRSSKKETSTTSMSSSMPLIGTKIKVFDNISVVALKKKDNTSLLQPIPNSLLSFKTSRIGKGSKREIVSKNSFSSAKAVF